MSRLIAAVAVLVVLAASAPAHAEGGPNGGCGLVVRIANNMYVDDRSGGDPMRMAGAVWLYVESNGVRGLQAGGVAVHGLYRDSGCDQSARPDTLIF